MTRVLVTGARGLLAAAIIRELSPDHDIRAVDRGALDVTDRRAVGRVIADARPAIVINCAAFNDVDGAEDDPETALGVNAFAVLALSQQAHEAGATLVHFSTDFVFDGDTDRPYTEADRPNPRGAYAASKLLGEWFALERQPVYVLRVESLFGEPDGDTLRQRSIGRIVSRLRAGERVPVFVDRTVSPTYTTDVARAVRQLLERRVSPGLYHCVNAGAARWSDVALEVARLLGCEPRLEPITLDGVAFRAPRPKYCALSNAKLRALGIVMPSWQDALSRHLAADKNPGA